MHIRKRHHWYQFALSDLLWLILVAALATTAGLKHRENEVMRDAIAREADHSQLFTFFLSMGR